VSTNGFGVREFQLVLLRRMADYQPELVEDARAGLDANSTEMREVNARWQRMVRSRTFPGDARAYQSVLGEPVAVSDRQIGDFSYRSKRWRLPLWPELLFEAVTGPGSTLLNSALIRDPGLPPPTLHHRGELTAWSCVIGDVERCFPPARHAEGSAPSRWTIRFTAPDAEGRPVGLVGRFVWGLLQAVEDLPRGS
jgi:hypothetical protein